MANPSKKKGTGGETELLLKLGLPNLRRTPPGTLWDLEMPGVTEKEVPIRLLATRPDQGRWLITMTLNDFRRLYRPQDIVYGLRVEVKRYKRFSLHNIFESKFGAKK